MKHEPVSVGLIAKSILSSIEQSSKKLAVEIKFNCKECSDTGIVYKERGVATCRCRVAKIAEKKDGEFF